MLHKRIYDTEEKSAMKCIRSEDDLASKLVHFAKQNAEYFWVISRQVCFASNAPAYCSVC